MTFGRASSLDRQLKCHGGELLGGVDEKSEYVKTAADWGTMVHHWKETGEVVAVNGRDNLVPLFHKKLKQSGVRREQWWPASMTHEIAFAVKPFEAYASMIEGSKAEKEDWKKSFNDDWATGTEDGEDWMFDILWVDDLKTGRFVELEQHIEQLRFYALGASRRLDYHGPVNVTLTHWPRYPVIGQPLRIGRMVEQDELLDFERRLRKLRDDKRRAHESRDNLRLVTGEHCTFCPGRSNCPEHQRETERDYDNGYMDERQDN